MKQKDLSLPNRLISIDVLRALTMFLMIFVNDAASLHQIPTWIDHAEMQEDRLGFADTIFPAFLFIVGLSLPFAIRNRKQKGDSFIALAGYVALRSTALIVMGFFHVNIDRYSSHALLPQPVWVILVTCGFFLVWLDYPPGWPRLRKWAGIGSGIVVLLLMVWLYKGGHDEGGMRRSWWGILGIIGWAYLVCATIFLFTGGRLWLLLTAFVLLAGINVLSHLHQLPFEVWLIGDASSVTLVMAGMVIAVLYAMLRQSTNNRVFLWILSLGGLLLLAAGLFIRPYAGGISKIYGTPAWVFICIGISLLAFACVTWLVDIKGKQAWFAILRPAGSSTLTCYLIPYFLYSIFWLVHFHYPSFLNRGAGGLTRSLLVALVVIAITGVLERKRIRLKI